MQQLFLGIDCGTQGTKALLVDTNGEPLGRGYAKHDLIERTTGAREQEPVWWIDAARSAVKIAMAQAGKPHVSAIGVSGQQHGLVVLDEYCEVIRPAKLWNDTETASENAELIERFGGKHVWSKLFGIVPRTGYTVSKLLWLRDQEPRNFARIRHILLPHEYLNYWLTGQMRAEFGDASGTGYFDVRNRAWAREVLDAIDGATGQLFAALPKIIQSDEIVGRLKPNVADELGISRECVVSSGGGDNMMGAIGTGNVREGIVTMSLGTSATVYSYSDRALADSSSAVAPFCSSSGGWLPLVCTMNATNVVTATLDILGKRVEDIDAALQTTKPGADGLTFLPFLNGERTPDLPKAQGSLLGITANNYSKENLIRAVAEGVSFSILDGLDLILQGKFANTIVVSGGGARSQAWRQMIADATGASVRLPAEDESGCLGAALQAMFAYQKLTGRAETLAQITDRCVKFNAQATLSSRAEQRQAYDEARRRYRTCLLKAYPEVNTTDNFGGANCSPEKPTEDR